MAEQLSSVWAALSEEVRDVFRWANACEKASPDVGTRALLVGVVRSSKGRNRAEDLLRHFDVSHEELFAALKAGDEFEFDPYVSKATRLSELPRLTGNARQCLSSASELASWAGRVTLDTDCLFGAILESRGTARQGMAHILGESLLDEVSRHYRSWLITNEGSYSQTLRHAFAAGRQLVVARQPDASYPVESAVPPVTTSQAPASGTPSGQDEAFRPPRGFGQGESDPSADAAAAPITIGNSTGAGNDTVAVLDQLGFDVYVEAFADLITSAHTAPPLTIGIFGSWGMGKSFLLEHIRRTIAARQAAGGTGPTIHTVRFNAWEYSSTDAIWPALVRKIVKELDQLDSWPRRKRVWTRLWWNLRREWRSLRTKVATSAVVTAGITAFAVGSTGVTTAVLATGTALGVGSLIKAANDPVGKWVTALFAGSDYGQQIRLMEDVKHDLDVLEQRLHTTDDRGQDKVVGRILVLIDDLDRCEPAKAVEVLQAVNLLLNFNSFIVCLGIDARIVTAAVEKHYEGLLGAAGASGYEYLDKIVQIPFRIPEPAPDDIGRFLRSQLDGDTDSGPARSTASSKWRAGSARPRSSHDDSSSGVQPSVTAGPDNLPVQDVPPALPVPQILFTGDERQAFEMFVDHLRPNPRHVKRLINVYRLVRSLGSAGNERLVLDRPAAVLRWLIMWSQWPYTSMVMLQRLDREAITSGNDGRLGSDPLLHLLDQVWDSIDLQAQELHDDDPHKLRSLLDVTGCQLSFDEIRRIRRYTVNFNPAVEEHRKVAGSGSGSGSEQLSARGSVS